MHGRRRLGLGFVAVLVSTALVNTASVPARADPAETERRLKYAAVDPDLRRRIHAAIERGASFLKKGQEADGSFRDRWTHGNRPRSEDHLGTTLLCALALRHVGTGATEEPVRRAIQWAFAPGPNGGKCPEQQVRPAGLALMLLDSVPGHEERIRSLAQALVAALDDATGYWGHHLREQDPPHPFEPMFPGLATSHLAILGLGAVRRRGVEMPVALWTRHAGALVKEQTASGSWRWHPASTQAALGHPVDTTVDDGTPVGRFLGLAGLLAARAVLENDPDETRSIDAAIRKARHRLDADVAEVLDDPAEMLMTGRFGRRGREIKFRNPQGSPGWPGKGAYMNLWALAGACLVANVASYERAVPGSRKAVARSWYVEGAEWLLRVQDPASGGWSPTAGNPVSPTSEIDTAYALLFLLRAPSAFHPVTPQPLDGPREGP